MRQIRLELFQKQEDMGERLLIKILHLNLLHGYPLSLNSIS